MPFDHMLKVIEVASKVHGDFCCALERVSDTTCVCFLFTQVNNFQFIIGVGEVVFEEVEPSCMKKLPEPARNL